MSMRTQGLGSKTVRSDGRPSFVWVSGMACNRWVLGWYCVRIDCLGRCWPCFGALRGGPGGRSHLLLGGHVRDVLITG